MLICIQAWHSDAFAGTPQPIMWLHIACNSVHQRSNGSCSLSVLVCSDIRGPVIAHHIGGVDYVIWWSRDFHTLACLAKCNKLHVLQFVWAYVCQAWVRENVCAPRSSLASSPSCLLPAVSPLALPHFPCDPPPLPPPACLRRSTTVHVCCTGRMTARVCGKSQEFDHGRDHLTFAAMWSDIHDLGRQWALQLPGSVLLHRCEGGPGLGVPARAVGLLRVAGWHLPVPGLLCECFVRVGSMCAKRARCMLGLDLGQ
eukprot:scaffold91156_cov18-Tisochrysis_lutea.AAC.1